MRFPILSSSLIVSLLLLSGPSLLAQEKPVAADIAAAYAGESFVIDRSDWVYSENADGTGYREHTVVVTVQSEAAVRAFGVVNVGFASASEHVEFRYARVRHKDGSVSETPASGAMEQPTEVTREAPFYSDLKEIQLPVKSLQAGDTLEWQARITKTRAEAPGQFWGAENFVSDEMVTLEESIELRVPSASAVKVWTNPKLAKAVESVDGATKVYRWQSAQLNATTGAAADAAKKAKKGKLLTADEELDAELGTLPSVAWTTFPSWEAVGAWYRGLEGQRAVPDDEIKAKVAELIAGKTTEEEKVRAVYAYVSAQIRYIGVAFGIGRFQPHEAADVLHNQYGDCKDKATLLASMLAVLGLHADSVLIGQEVRWNEAVPSPMAFNHLINRVKVGNEEVWLDATAEVAPYKVLLYPLRDKEALVIPEQGAAMVMKTPKDLPFPNVITWTAKGALDKDGISDSHVVMAMRGDIEVLYRAVTHQVAPAQYDQLAEKIVRSMGYQGALSHVEFSRPEDTGEPFTFTFDYHREKGGDWDNLRILPQLMPVPLGPLDEKDLPSTSLFLGAPHTETSEAEMKIPANWRVELPEAVHEKSKWATYDLTFRFEKGTVYAKRQIVTLVPRLLPDEWKEYKKFADATGLGNETYIQLRRGYGEVDKIEPPALEQKSDSKADKTADANLSVEELIDASDAAIRKFDTEKAKALLKQAEAKDPKAPRLWSSYAVLAADLGVMSEAEADAKKEIALHPKEADGYKAMFFVAQMRHDSAAIVPALQQWAALEPDNQEVQSSLAIAMLNDKKYPEAVNAATKALELMGPEEAEKNESLRLLLGEAQLHAGMTEKGGATLLALLKTTENPGIMNDAAYGLADAKLELPLDDAKVREALDRMTVESKAWTGDENVAMLSQQSNLLVATWDTMGWILFREGKTAEAKSYIGAAAEARDSAEVQGHLAEVNKALGVKPPKVTPGSQEARTFELGPANGRAGVAEYRLLIEQGKVLRVEPAGDKRVKGAEEMLQHVDFAKLFPVGVDARLVRHGMVNCYSGKCSLLLEP